jgi:hypothetical protein
MPPPVTRALIPLRSPHVARSPVQIELAKLTTVLPVELSLISHFDSVVYTPMAHQKVRHV